MRKIIFFFYLSLFVCSVKGQNQFIRSNNNQFFGQQIRIVSAMDDGWIIFSPDSLKMQRFDRCSQLQFSNQYILPVDSSGNVDIVRLTDNGCVILTQSVNTNGTSPVITKLDSVGNIIWCKVYSDSAYSELNCAISADSTGFIYLVTNGTSSVGTENTIITKIDYNGNVVSDLAVDKGSPSSDIILTSDSGMLIRTGNCFIKTNATGTVEWTTNVSAPVSVFSKPVETGDGYIFSCNVSLTGAISLIKLDKNGVLNIQKRTDFIGLPPQLKMRTDQTVCGMFQRTFSGIDYSTLVVIDSNLNIVMQRSNNYFDSNNSLKLHDFDLQKDNLLIIAGVTSPDGSMFYGRTDEYFNSGCDTTLANIQIVQEGVTQTFSSTYIIPHSHVIDDLIASKIAFADSQELKCSVPIQIAIGGDTLICSDRPAFLTNVGSDYFDKYFWSNGDTSRLVIIDEPDKYWLMGIGHCNLDTLVDTVEVIKREFVPVELGDDKYKCQVNQLMLTGPGCNQCTYLWNDGSLGQSMNVRSYGPQWLKINNEGCITSDTLNVLEAKCECHFFLPNTITPNHDGVNDLLKPVYYCDLDNYSMKIFNRWGELIFETDDAEQAWDAKYHNILVEQGVYVYQVSFTSLMEGVAGEQIVKVGSLGVLY